MIGFRCEIDERGWRVPQANTMTRRVYDLMLEGKGPKAIATVLKTSFSTVGVCMWRIRHPFDANLAERDQYHKYKSGKRNARRNVLSSGGDATRPRQGVAKG